MSSVTGFLKKIHGAILRAKHGLYITKYLGVRQLIAIAAAKSTPPNGLQSQEALHVCAVSLSSFSGSVLHVRTIFVHVLQASLLILPSFEMSEAVGNIYRITNYDYSVKRKRKFLTVNKM